MAVSKAREYAGNKGLNTLSIVAALARSADTVVAVVVGRERRGAEGRLDVVVVGGAGWAL